MKALAILRVSTTSQQLDDQKEELINFLKDQGYDEIIPLEAVGASAIKMDDKYMELVQKVKDTILSDKEVKAAGVWELSRLGRNEVILMQFKEFFIENKIQFVCKTPYMKLLEPDGSVNGGMELAFSLYATMAKQEMAEKKSRFKRAKKSMASKGMYVGGNTIPFGYTIDEQGFYQEKPEESATIKLAFELYATGKYSTYTLSKELEERGIHVKDYTLAKILRNTAYLGKEVEGELGVHYPPIISQELFDAVEKIRAKNKIEMKKSNIVLGAKLIKCPKCGATCTSNSRHYVCCRHSHRGPCDNGFALRQCVADNLLWRVASILHVEYITNLNSDKRKEYENQIQILEQKVMAIDEKIEKSEVKKSRIIDSYMDGLISKETRDLRLSKVKDEVDAQLLSKVSLQEKIGAFRGLMKGIDSDMDYINAMANASIIEYSDMEKYDIIHLHIMSLTAEPQSFGHRDPRTKKPNGVLITINTVGEPWKFMYVPKFLDGHNLYSWSRGRWVPDSIEITDKKVSQ